MALVTTPERYNDFREKRREGMTLGQSAVLAPGMCAFFAPEKLGRRFVPASSLEKPPEGGVVPAFWAFDVGGGHCFYSLLLFSDDFHFSARIRVDLFGPRDRRLRRLGIATLFADQYGMRFLRLESQSRAAVGTEFQFLN